jgi:hypothetical protein
MVTPILSHPYSKALVVEPAFYFVWKFFNQLCKKINSRIEKRNAFGTSFGQSDNLQFYLKNRITHLDCNWLVWIAGFFKIFNKWNIIILTTTKQLKSSMFFLINLLNVSIIYDACSSKSLELGSKYFCKFSLIFSMRNYLFLPKWKCWITKLPSISMYCFVSFNITCWHIFNKLPAKGIKK